jgi:arylformamidase
MSQAVYRDFDAEAMEMQYNPRRTVDGVDGIVAEWAARSKTFTDSHDYALDIAYGDRPEEKLDVYRPAASNAPVLIFIHGGYWRALDKQPFAFMCEALVDAGALVVSINYTLCPAVTLDEIVRQCRAACAWVRRNVADHGGDPGRIHVTGHSAGGHLTAMMAATDWPGFAADLPADLLKSASPLSGLFDLAPILQTSINADVRMDPAAATRNSPQALKPAHDMPMTVAVGGAESDEFRRQSKEFAEYWGRSLSRIDYLETPGENHFTIIDGIARAGSPITRALLGHMGL